MQYVKHFAISVLLVAHSAPGMVNSVPLAAFNANFWQTVLEHRLVCCKLAASMQQTCSTLFILGRGPYLILPVETRLSACDNGYL